MTLQLVGKTYLVTGANAGIGRATALALARQGARVWLACRSIETAEPVADEIGVEGKGSAELVQLSLDDLDSVRACAAAFHAREGGGGVLHGLVNNAGVGWTNGGSTKQGFELLFGVNHLGHFLLTNLLLDALRAAPRARIVNVASMAHYRARAIDWSALRRPTAHWLGRPEYAVSKLCNVLHAKELARRLGTIAAGATVTTYSLHPGVVVSDMWRHLPRPLRRLVAQRMARSVSKRALTAEEGAKTTVWCASAPELADETGRYYDECREKPASPLADDASLARELWERSEAWTAA